ncbi:tetratricopeptide repeat protein [Thalassobaculum sp.]|uniref:tetratricopeptide repeat protein n=1 Tax=Thalassobaculum sp. TaxID=2022740 RepID=UPI0032EDA5C4
MTATAPVPPTVAAAYRQYRDGRPAAALAALAAAGDDALGHPAGPLLRGALELDERRPESALRAFQHAAVLDPSLGGTYGNAAVALRRVNSLEAALRLARRSVVLSPTGAAARNAVTAVLLDLDRPAPALAVAEAVLSDHRGDAEADLNRGLALQRLGRLDEARAVLDAAVRRRPGDPAPLHARGYLRLLQGDLPAGWREREARWSLPNQMAMRTEPGIALWNGEPLDGRHLLVIADEGRGDMIQYVRFLRRPPLAEARLTLLARAYMVRLFAPALPGVDVRAAPPEMPADFQTPLSRVPAVLGTGLAEIPADIPYLAAEPDRVERWRTRIGDRGFRIAVCWQGNPGTPVDRGRSIPLAAFAPLAAVPGVRLIALQARHGTEQLADLPAGMTVETLGPDYDRGPDSFVDPAAVACAVDLVVSSDTALAHLAGALGRPVWLALRKIPDFRWLLGREDSPWYPTARLFRQRSEGDWAEVMARIAEAVRQRMAAAGTPG